MRKITHLVVHCTDSDHSTVASITRFHRVVKKWKTIGYHRVVNADGSVDQGRDDARPGAHTAGFNKSTLAIVMVGALNDHPPTDAQLRATAHELAMWAAAHRLDPWAAILGHRETWPFVPKLLRTKKPCPGKMTNMHLLRSLVAMELDRDGS